MHNSKRAKVPSSLKGKLGRVQSFQTLWAVSFTVTSVWNNEEAGDTHSVTSL